MLLASRPTTTRGPAFIRLLVRLTGMQVTSPHSSLSDRLSQWLDWNHALALSTALDGKSSADVGKLPTMERIGHEECARVRSVQASAIVGGPESNDVRRGRAGKDSDDGVALDEAIDYAVFRQRYLARQRAMQSATGELRGRLRQLLASQSEDMARLADVDAAMELALSPREQTLLAVVPDVLEIHFENLRQASLVATRVATRRGNWQNIFRNDMQSVLLAELDVRFQPVEALLAALRTR